MDGEWEFYWKEFLYSNPSGNPPQPILLRTQTSWHGQKFWEIELPKFGYGTYRSTVLLPVDRKIPDLGIRLPQIASCYRLYVNQKLVYSLGKAGKTREESEPFIRNVYLPIHISAEVRNLEIALEIANYENEGPGFWQIPYLGPLEEIHSMQVFAVANDLFLFGCLLVMGFYHSGIYLFHRSQKSILYFSFFSYLLAIRIILTGERYILELVPSLDWRLLFRIEFLDLYLLPSSFAIYMFYLYPQETKKRIVQVFSVVISLFCFSVLFPIHVFTGYVKLFLIFLILISLYVLYINIAAVRNRREDSLTFLLGLLALVVTSIYDIIQDFRNIRGFALAPYGFLFFVFIQAIVLSSRIASSFVRAENLALSLSRSNVELTNLKNNLEEMVEVRTHKLKETLSLIRKDLDIAKSIQSKLIPKNFYQWENLEIASLYRPMDEVGGDIFDITELDSDRIRIFLADALGHGVQAALLTMAIKSEYEGVKFVSYTPKDTICNLNASFLHKFSNLNTYFSCIVVDVDLKHNQLLYASAGHPDQILISAENLIRLERTGYILGLSRNLQMELREFSFLPGDRVFLYSDGAFEQFNESKEIFGEVALSEILFEGSRRGDSLPTLLFEIERKLRGFLGEAKIQDDLTILGISRR